MEKKKRNCLFYALIMASIFFLFTVLAISGLWWWLKSDPTSPSENKLHVVQIPGPTPKDRNSISRIIDDINVHELFQEKGISDQEMAELASVWLKGMAVPLDPSENDISIARRLMSGTGLRTGKSSIHTYNASYEEAIRSVVIGLALTGVTIKMAGDTPKGGVLICSPPQGLLAWDRYMVIEFQAIDSNKTLVITEVEAHGQLYDWGSSQLLIDDLHKATSRHSGIFIEQNQ